jgi:hypothetical protein
MLADLEVMIKIVVDIRREIMSGGGDMHYDGGQLSGHVTTIGR